MAARRRAWGEAFGRLLREMTLIRSFRNHRHARTLTLLRYHHSDVLRPSERHHAPHFHAYYGEHVAVFSVSPVALVIGFIPQRQQRLVEAWAELHEEELLADWQLLERGRKPSPISPLQ